MHFRIGQRHRTLPDSPEFDETPECQSATEEEHRERRRDAVLRGPTLARES